MRKSINTPGKTFMMIMCVLTNKNMMEINYTHQREYIGVNGLPPYSPLETLTPQKELKCIVLKLCRDKAQSEKHSPFDGFKCCQLPPRGRHRVNFFRDFISSPKIQKCLQSIRKEREIPVQEI